MVKKLQLQERGRATRGTDKFKGYGVFLRSMHNNVPYLAVYATKREALDAVDTLKYLDDAEDDFGYDDIFNTAMEGHIDWFEFNPRWIEDNDTYVKFDDIYYIVNPKHWIDVYGL